MHYSYVAVLATLDLDQCKCCEVFHRAGCLLLFSRLLVALDLAPDFSAKAECFIAAAAADEQLFNMCLSQGDCI